MLTQVKLSSLDTTVGEIRALFADEHVHSAVIVDGGLLAAVVDRNDVQEFPDDVSALALGCWNGRVVSPDTELHEARELLVRSGRRRLAVVGPDGTFLGLLCLKRTRQDFCSDRDVRSRTRALRAGALLSS